MQRCLLEKPKVFLIIHLNDKSSHVENKRFAVTWLNQNGKKGLELQKSRTLMLIEVFY